MAQSSYVGLHEAPRAELSEPFCSYCGYSPVGVRRRRADRVCERCGLGVILYAPAGSAPEAREPFVILDQQLSVQAVSSVAEMLLRVNEPSVLGDPLDGFLVSADGDADDAQLWRLIALALAGTPCSDPLQLRTADSRQTYFDAYVTSCGPPAAALIVLTAITCPAAPSAIRELRARVGGRTGEGQSRNGANGAGK
jgi:hypothetical protein